MSKKPRQSRHRVPTLALTPVEITPEYQAEVDASMEKLRKRYERAEKALVQVEAKAARAAEHAANLARKQAEVEAIAANRLAEEQRLNEYIDRIKRAARDARVAEARAELERKRDAAIVRRNAETARRKEELKAAREHALLVAQSRLRHESLEELADDRRRELREIERLMMPGNYVGREHRGRGAAKHRSGGAA